MSAPTPFTLDSYLGIVATLRQRGYDVVDYENVEPARPHLILRHDVDMSLERAVEMAAAEAGAGLRATYFVLVDTGFYNVASRAGRAALAALVGFGQAVGLHLDAAGLEDDATALEAKAAFECGVLENLLGRAVATISFHRPVPALQNLARPVAGRRHAYQPRFFTEMGYCSDSQGRFRFHAPLDHPAVAAGTALQLLIHPIWWVGTGQGNPVGALDALRREQDERFAAYLAENCLPYRLARSGAAG